MGSLLALGKLLCMAAQIKNVLTRLGLTETEARVYLGMLKLGPDTVQHIAREAHISRTAAYEIISGLQKKGLASTFTQGKRKNFVAEDPEKLEGYFEQRIRDVQLELGSLRRIVPELRMLQGGVSDRPRVRFYKGDEAVRAIYRDLALVSPDELLEYTNIDAVYATVDPKVLAEARASVDYERLKVKVLHLGSLRNPSPKIEYKQMENEDVLEFDGDVWIYGNRIALIHFMGNVEVVIIDNHIFAATLRSMFYAAWNRAGIKKK